MHKIFLIDFLFECQKLNIVRISCFPSASVTAHSIKKTETKPVVHEYELQLELFSGLIYKNIKVNYVNSTDIVSPFT